MNTVPSMIVWSEVKQEIHTLSNLAVSIKKNNHYYPQYSIVCGWVNADKLFIPHMVVRVRYEHGKAAVTRVSEVYAILIAKAEEWIAIDSQWDEDKRIENRITKEEKSANLNKTVTRYTGKTERDREKRVGK